MYYSLCVATDFRGHKVNLQFFFDSHGPQLAQILSRASEAFNQFFRSKGVLDRPFSVTTAVIFNERYETWDRLERSAQLVHNGQIYLFQPDVNDVPAEIPDPISASQYLTDYVSPQRSFVNNNNSNNDGGYGYGQRSSSPGAQIPSSYDSYARRRHLDASPAYQPHYASSSSTYAPIPPTTRPPIGGVGYSAGAVHSIARSPAGRAPSTSHYTYDSHTATNTASAFAAAFGDSPYGGSAPIGGGGPSSSSYAYGTNASPSPPRGSAAGGAGLAYGSPYRGSQSRADLENNADYVALMRRAASSQRRPYTSDLDGPSIFEEERRHDAELSRLELDRYREVVRSEAREFTPSPSRERVY